MKLFVPEPEITLYEQGFDGIDKLNRKEQGDRLSNLVENIEDPMVIALDGQWGSGKSVFLKCWVGEHTQSSYFKSKPIYFDAFAHDFMNDPLIALISILDEQMQKSKGLLKKGWSKIKSTAPLLTRLGLAVGTAGISEAVGAVGDAAIDTISKSAEEAVNNFWQSENAKRDAVNGFREALKQVAQEQKLVIVIDELDRCRPDFALSLLEIVKHLFKVPNVHFVLGINLESLEHSVRAVYGPKIDAPKYLHKFYNVSFSLRRQNASHPSNSEIVDYFNHVGTEMGIASNNGAFTALSDLLHVIKNRHIVTFRDVNRLLEKLAILKASEAIEGHAEKVAILAVMQILNRDLFTKFVRQTTLRNALSILQWIGLTDVDPTHNIAPSRVNADLAAFVRYVAEDERKLQQTIRLIIEQERGYLPSNLMQMTNKSQEELEVSYHERISIMSNRILVPFISLQNI